MYTEHCTVYIWYNVHCTLYIVQCTIYKTTPYTEYTIHLNTKCRSNLECRHDIDIVVNNELAVSLTVDSSNATTIYGIILYNK